MSDSEGVTWEIIEPPINKVGTDYKLVRARGVKPGVRFKAMFKGEYDGKGGAPATWGAGIILADLQADADNNSTAPQRPPTVGDDAENYREQAPTIANVKQPGLVLAVNRGYEEDGHDASSKRIEDFVAPGIRLDDPDLVLADLTWKLPAEVTGKGRIMYDGASAKVYLRTAGGFALVPADGDFLPVTEQPLITPATVSDPAGKVLAWGRSNTLLIEGVAPSATCGSDHLLATLMPDRGVMNSEDALFYTVVDVRIVTAKQFEPTRVLMVSNRPVKEEFTGEDPDEFCVEVVDASIPPTVTHFEDRVELEAMKSIYPGTPFSPARVLPFPTLNSMNRVPGKPVFRSKPLRLVSDTQDNKLKINRTLLADTEIDDAGAGPATDILGQWVWARYKPAASATKSIICRAHATVSDIDRITATTDDDPRRVNLELMIFPGKQSNMLIRAGVFRWMTRTYAQAGIASPQIESIVPVTVQSRTNVTTIGIGTSLPFSEMSASGKTSSGKQSVVVIRVQQGATASVPISMKLKPGDTPDQIASNLLTEITKFGLGCSKRGNPRLLRSLSAQFSNSADLVFDPTVEISAINSSDTILQCEISQILKNGKPEAPVFHAECLGSRVTRSFWRNYVSVNHGSIISVFVVPQITKSSPSSADPLGMAVLSWGYLNLDWQPIADAKNICFVEEASIVPASKNPFTLPHEIGHILLDHSHSDSPDQLMFSISGVLTKRLAAEPEIFSFPALPQGTNSGNPPKMVAQVQTIRQKFSHFFTEMHR